MPLPSHWAAIATVAEDTISDFYQRLSQRVTLVKCGPAVCSVHDIVMSTKKDMVCL